ncbi:hypothetical protein [Streptomyces orinoci]|uniref:Uncharacterized protein n=1 Tax=Streptomyces orinoci TaxID=67339 RepID=A0ABV3K6C9_STRON|nr:hypothetical protein [Streptomyces orinoci]
MERRLTLRGVSLARIRADPVLGEAFATGADPLHLGVLFDLPGHCREVRRELACRVLYDPFGQKPICEREKRDRLRRERWGCRALEPVSAP